MPAVDSSLDQEELARARVLLTAPKRRDRLWPALLAATALAVSSVAFATVAILAPPIGDEHVAKSAPG